MIVDKVETAPSAFSQAIFRLVRLVEKAAPNHITLKS